MIQKQNSFISLILVTILFLLPAHAAEQDKFNPEKANKVLDKISIKLSIEQPNSESLQNAANTLMKHQKKAQACVEVGEKELNELKALAPQETISETDTVTKEISKDQEFINAKKKSIDKQLSECRLFILRADEAIRAFSETAQDLSTTAIFMQGSNIERQLTSLKKNITEFTTTFSLSGMMAQASISWFSTLDLISFSIVLILSIILSTMITIESRINLLKFNPINPSDEIKRTLLSILQGKAFSIPPLLFAVGFIGTLGALHQDIPFALAFLFVLLGFQLIQIMISFFFLPPEPGLPFFTLTKKYAHLLSIRLHLLNWTIFLSCITLLILRSQNAHEDLVFFFRTFSISLITINLASIILKVNRSPKLFASFKALKIIISISIIVFAFVVLSSEWMGYQQFSNYLIKGITISFFLTILAWGSNRYLQSLLSNWKEAQSKFQKKLFKKLGLKKDGILSEIIGVQIALYLLIWGAYLIVLSNIWNITQTWTYHITDIFDRSLTIPNTDIHFIPSHIVFSLVTFTFLFILTRFVRNRIQKNALNKDKAQREAMGSIFGYTGFVIAIVFALMIAGINLKGLALIAGALSVGIGFGLQNIVSNFVSGLILLLERPIKPGDRITIGTDEGFVRKVSIRSTRISTLENIDIIVPNADLISNQVKNQTLFNTRWRVTIRLGVAYGSDVRLVERLLMKAALDHPEVMDDEDDKPTVYFMDFGESALSFSMWCIIQNVNMKLKVLSDLHFAINDLFQEHGIVIPLPQRVIHMATPPPPFLGGPVNE